MSAHLIAPWQTILRVQSYIDRYLPFNGMAHGESTPTGYDGVGTRSRERHFHVGLSPSEVYVCLPKPGRQIGRESQFIPAEPASEQSAQNYGGQRTYRNRLPPTRKNFQANPLHYCSYINAHLIGAVHPGGCNSRSGTGVLRYRWRPIWKWKRIHHRPGHRAVDTAEGNSYCLHERIGTFERHGPHRKSVGHRPEATLLRKPHPTLQGIAQRVGIEAIYFHNRTAVAKHHRAVQFVKTPEGEHIRHVHTEGLTLEAVDRLHPFRKHGLISGQIRRQPV